MAIEKIETEKFLELGKSFPVLDVRSPSEYNHAHIPGAHSFPLFNDEERKTVGTAYKQQSREAAIKIGMDYFGVKMRKMVEDAETIISSSNSDKQTGRSPQQEPGDHHNVQPRRLTLRDIGETTHSTPSPPVVLVHCWRGGMRSAAVAWILDLYGFEVYILSGGYKKFRQYVLETFTLPLQLTILGGFTGSGKTKMLRQLAGHGHTVIDLEQLANHKGSAFGAIGQPPQPSQEMFEALLALELRSKSSNPGSQYTRLYESSAESIWLEDESQRIGNIILPPGLWKQMRKSKVYFLDVPFEARLDYIADSYGRLDKGEISNAILRIQKRLGGLETFTALNRLAGENKRECFRILLKYYDKCYSKGLQGREVPAEDIKIVSCAGGDEKQNIKSLVSVIESESKIERNAISTHES